MRHDGMVKIADTCADDAEVLALSTFRMVAAGYSTGDVACWDMAYAGAERLLSPEAAGQLVASVTTLIRAVRAERSGAWIFMPVSCCRVTADEANIVRLISAARRGDTREITWAAREVTGATESLVTETAARVIARVLDETAVTLKERACVSREAAAVFH